MLDQKVYATIKDQPGLQVRSRHRGYLGDQGISGAISISPLGRIKNCFRS
jgi:hypothetical protein